MLSYSAIKQDDKLVNITKIMPQMTAADTVGEFRLNAPGEWFYFTDSINKALYETTKQANDGVIVKRSDNVSIMDAFSQAIALGLDTYTIYAQPQVAEQPTLTESQTSEIQHRVVEKLILPEIIQPYRILDAEQLPPQFQLYTADPQFEEIITPAESWAWNKIALPIIAKGIKVYNDNIPPNTVRPREYVVMSVDDDITDINFSGNKNNKTESLVTFIIQGEGNTFQNWVVEISNSIMDILRKERKNGKVRNISNRNIGLDEITNLLSRVITVIYEY